MARDQHQSGRRTRRISLTDRPRANAAALDHAVRLIEQVCRGSGFTDVIANARRSLRAQGVARAVRRHDTAVLFDWLMSTLSYQGIADQVAADYMDRHGNATSFGIASDLARRPSCPKLSSYWH